MKGDNLTTGLTDEMSSHVAKCGDVLENLKENSQLVHRLNGLDVSMQDVECHFMPTSLQRTDTMEKNCVRLESFKLNKKTEHTILSRISEITSNQNMISDVINKKISHSETSLRNIQSSTAKENCDQIQEQTEQEPLFKIPNSPSCVKGAMHLEISPPKIERLREVLDSILKTPLREVLKAKFHSRTKHASDSEMCLKESITKFPVSHQKRSKHSKKYSKGEHFIVENCFKICDKNEIKTILSPLMKTSLSEILRSKVNAQSISNSRVLDTPRSETDSSENDCYKNCSKDSFTESENSNSLLHRFDETSLGISKNNITQTNLSDESICQRDVSNDNEQQKEVSSDESSRWFIRSTNSDCERSLINLSSSAERWKTAASPLLKTSISDILRRKLNKSNEKIEISHETVPKKSIHSSTTNMKRHRIILNERVTRSKQQFIQTRSKREKNINEDISFISSAKSHTLTKPRTVKLKENSVEENISETSMPSLIPQICDITIGMQEKVSLTSITKKKTKKKHFRGGKYNFNTSFSKRKNRQAKSGKDDESASGIQSEGGSCLTDRWPSDVSLHGSFSSFSSDHFINNEDVNHSRLKSNQICVTENENFIICRKSSSSPDIVATSHAISTKACEIDNCSKSLETKHFMKETSNNLIENTLDTLQHNKNYTDNQSPQTANKEDINKANESRMVISANLQLPVNINISNETHSLKLPIEYKKDHVCREGVKVKISKEISQKLEQSSNQNKSIADDKENRIGRVHHQDKYSSDKSSFLQLSQNNCNNGKILNPSSKEKDFHCDQNEGIPANTASEIKEKVQCSEKHLDTESAVVTCIKNTTKAEMFTNDLVTVSYADNTSNFDENDVKQSPQQNAGDKLRELINQRQDVGDDGVFVTITINADGIVEDIERIDPSLFVDVTTLSSFVPIEESNEVPANHSSVPALDNMPTNDETNSKVSEATMVVEESPIPEPCYTLEIMGDSVSTVTTEQFQGTERQFEISSASELSIGSSTGEKVSSEEMKNNGFQKETLSIASNVKGRRRSKRKFPEDHFDVDCISLTSSSSTENETESSTQRKRNKSSSFLLQENSEIISSPPKLKLETCSVFDNIQQGEPCHKTLYTTTVGLYLVNELYLSEQNLLKRRTGINLENPRLTICHHHKKVFLDKFDEIQKADNGSSITICSCYDSPVEIEKDEATAGQLSVCCEAKDSIDDKVIGCSNFVTKHQLVHASEKVSRVALCEVHLWRLHHHQCCPNCGIFCTQGTFSQCITQRKSHCQLHLFHTDCIPPPSNGLNAYCPHCGAESDFRKIKLELNIHLSPPNWPKNKALIRSETNSLAQEDQIENNIHKKTGESIKSASSTIAVPEKFCLNKEQQQALLFAVEDVNRNARSVATKSSYGPIKTGDVDRFLYMLAAGFNPNHRFEDHKNDTPLHIAAEIGHLALVQILIQIGASVDHTNDDLITPLMLAVENNHIAVISYLLMAGAHLDARNEDGTTTLHLAAQDGHSEICNILLDTGKIDINIQDDGGWTPLVWAAENQHLETVELLLKRGADPNIRDNEENVSLHWSAYSGNVDISQLFLDVGCELCAANVRGDTPLHISARRGNYECVILFLARGADTKIKNCNNETPIMCCLDQHSQTWMVLSMNDGENFCLEKNLKPQGKLLHRDISRGQEFTPIQCYNGEDDKPVPQDFTYITENCEIGYVNIDRTITSLQSCRCNNKCRYLTCSCAALSFKCWYDEKSHLLPEFNMSDPPMIFECNPGCLCWKDCSSRVVQYGIQCHLQVFRTEEIEWGVRTLQEIPKGTFVCEYVGEYVTESEAEKRTDDSYLFELDSREEVKYCLDAKYFGNVGRFINHLCDANLCPVKVFIEHQDLNFPRIAFFTTRHVKSYEELGFDYGPKYWSAKYKQGMFCLCNSSKCRYNRDSISSTLNDFSHTSEEEQSKDETL